MPSDSAWPEEARLWPPDPLSMRQMHAGSVHPLRLRLRLRVYQKSRRCSHRWNKPSESGSGRRAAELRGRVKSHREHKAMERVRPCRRLRERRC
jgi:hypothetical protein